MTFAHFNILFACTKFTTQRRYSIAHRIEMPILVRSSPEGSALPTYIVIAIQMANAGPIIYTLLQQRRYKINEPLCILGILTLGNISMAFLIFFYDKTVILSNSEYSMALFILTFFTALVGCFSSVLFMPYLRNYNPTYVISYFIGEGLSGVLPSLVALIQSVGEQMETTNDTLIAFIILQYSSFVKNIKTTFEENKSNQNGKQATYYNIQNKLPSTSNNLYKESEQAMEQVLSNNTINEIRNPKADHEMSLYKKSYLLILMSLLCFFANGFLPSIQLYSCLPYGDITYRLSITLVQFANPIACFIAFWIMPLNLNIINSLSTIILVFCTYVIYVALMSPFVPLRESEIVVDPVSRSKGSKERERFHRWNESCAPIEDFLFNTLPFLSSFYVVKVFKKSSNMFL
ncbi:hypothetical protein KPH14_011319 [Odynerus spinipes]|uniref:Riboflavin transporter n=1 Tax=Odynerus spinipes TaxID=1348599 RepID=A0AAD9VJ48_9HYME|nr:hypothetical protein KPH14_011319 [Odynerus spinipes]